MTSFFCGAACSEEPSSADSAEDSNAASVTSDVSASVLSEDASSPEDVSDVSVSAETISLVVSISSLVSLRIFVTFDSPTVAS